MKYLLKRIRVIGICICIVALSVTSVYADPVSGQGTWETTLQPRSLFDPPNTAEAYFDTTLGVTWWENSGVFDPFLTWEEAKSLEWFFMIGATGLEGWRLPTLITNASGEVIYSEMQSLNEDTLGNTQYNVSNTGPFIASINVWNGPYWTDVESVQDTSEAWTYSFGAAQHAPFLKITDRLVAFAVHDGDVGTPIAQSVNCVGRDTGIFDAPLDAPVTAKHAARVLPFSMMLIDEFGNPLSDATISPPLIQVDVTPGDTGSAPPPAILEYAGKGDDGNQFSFNGTKWSFNLKLKNFSGAGEYTATVVSGDPLAYAVSPTCQGVFYIMN